MNLTLSQKERLLLEDQKAHEQLCIDKYTKYSNEATEPQLKQLFLNHAAQEQEHLNSLNQMLSGQVPNTNQQGAQSGNAQNTSSTGSNAGTPNENDGKLCKDLLMTEKFVSSAYNTTIFEFRDTNAREVLNHIQKEEQKHGEDLYNYLASHNMYNIQ